MSRSQLLLVAAFVSALVVSAKGGFLVNQYAQHEQTAPAVAMNANGKFVVIWRSHASDGRSGGVYARRYDAGGVPVSDEFKINTTDVDADSWTPAVAMDASGGFVVAWVAARGGGIDTDIVARRFNDQGTPVTEEFAVSVSPDAAQSLPALSMNASGAFVVVWAAWYGNEIHGRSYATGRVFDANGTPKTDEFRVNGEAQEDWPDVAMDDSGRFVVSWVRIGDTYNRPYGDDVMCRRFDADGKPIGGAITLAADVESQWYGSAVAADRMGGFVVTWARGPFPYDIMTQAFDPNGVAVTKPCLVNGQQAGDQGRPAIAGDGGGNFLIAWDNHSVDGFCCGVSGRPYTSCGQLPGQEVVFCAPQALRQWYPRVALASGGRYVVVWIGQASDGMYDVYAQTGVLP